MTDRSSSTEQYLEDEDLDLDAPASEDAEAMDAPAAAEAPLVAATLDPAQQSRLIEAILLTADKPLDYAALSAKLPGADLVTLLTQLQSDYAPRGINLVCHGGGWAFRTAVDLAPALRGERAAPPVRKPPRAAVETLAIIAYHQPVTRAEIESIRGVATSRGTLDILMEAGWIRPGRRRETPGRPVTWLTTPAFLAHFGLASLTDLPGIEELKAAGLLDAKPVLATMPAEPELDGLGVKGVEHDEEEGAFLADEEGLAAERAEAEDETEVEDSDLGEDPEEESARAESAEDDEEDDSDDEDSDDEDSDDDDFADDDDGDDEDDDGDDEDEDEDDLAEEDQLVEDVA